MPGVSLKLQGLRGTTAHSHKTALWKRVGPLLFCLGLTASTLLRADSASSVPAPTPSPVPAPQIHLTDAQDQLATGQLSPEAEARSRANALYAQAMLDGASNQPETALKQLRQVVSLDPHFADAQVNLATLLIQGGQIHEALEQLQSATLANPQSIAIETMLGFVQRENDNSSEALRLSKDALTRDPTQATAMRVLLQIAAEQNDLAGGVLHIEDILKAAGDNVTAAPWLNLARLYLEISRADVHPASNVTALKTLLPIYQQASEKSPPDVEPLTLLSDTYRDLGLKREALKPLQQASALDPDDVDIILRCADLQNDLGQKAECLKSYEKAYSLNPGLAGLCETLGRLYLDGGRYSDATRLLQKAFNDAPQDPGIGIDLGMAYERNHDLANAQKCFEQVLASASCPPEAYLKLAVFQLSRDEIQPAAATLAAAEKRFPNSARVRFYEAVEHRYEKNYNAALACLDQMRQLAAAGDAEALDLNYYLECALTLNLAGKKDRIETVLHEGLAKFPDSPDLMNELAYFWADQGAHLPEALTLSQRAAELAPDNGAIQDTRGWVLFQMGKAKDALPYLQRATILTNNDPVVLQHVGDVYMKLGLRSEALAAWHRAQEKAPRNGDLANRIDAAMAQAKNAHLRSAPTP